MNEFSHKRIMIFGLPRSGKSTFALRLSKVLELPLHHLDKYFFTEQWIERPEREFLEIQRSLVREDRWIIDGNSIHSLEARYKRADVVLYMCFPRGLCLLRIFQRLFKKESEILGRAINCKECVTWKLIRYLWNFDHKIVAELSRLQAAYPKVQYYKISNGQEREELFRFITLVSLKK